MSGVAATFQPGDRVRYVPYHADNDILHPDCESGVVTSINAHAVFVRFDGDLHSKGCYPDTLVHVGSERRAIAEPQS